jgi:PAS domain S-box-containing protein
MSSHRTQRGFSIGRPAAGLLVAALAVVLLLGYLIWSGYQETIRGAATTSANYAAMLETRLEATLRRADAALLYLSRTVPVEALNKQAVPRHAARLNAELDGHIVNFPELAGMRIIDADGDVIYTSDSANVQRINIADRDYFRVLRDDPQAGLVFSEVIANRVSGRPRLVAARALRDGRGVFRGVVFASVELDYFQKLFESLDIGAHGIVAIYRSDDFSRVLRRPRDERALNEKLAPGNPARMDFESGGRQATREIVSLTDGVARIYSWQGLDSHPFFITVGIARDDVLAAWRARSIFVALLCLLLLGVLALIVLRLTRAETRLRENGALMKSTFEQAAVGIAHVDASSFRIRVLNERFCSLLGYRREELIGTDSRRLSPPDEFAMRKAERARLLSGEVKTLSCERRLLRKDGSLLWVNRSLSLVRDAAGKPHYYISVIEDISVRKQATDAQAYLAAIVDSSNDAIMSRSLDRKILTWNLGAERLFGYRADEVIGQSASLIIPPERLAEAARSRALVESSSAVLDLVTQRLAKGGRRIDVSMSQSPVKNDRGETVGVALIFRDIGDRVRKAALMQLLEALARSTNEANRPEAAMQACLDRICAYGNWQFGRFVLFAPGQTGGFAPTSLWHCENRAQYAEFVRLSEGISINTRGIGQFVSRAIRERRAIWLEEFARVPDFGRRDIVDTFGLRAGFVFPVFVSGEIAGFVEFFATETRAPDEMMLDAIQSVASQLARLIERSRAEAALARLNAELESRVVSRTAELEAVNRELSDFSYTIAHDLRTPLRAINGFTSMVVADNEGKLDAVSAGHLQRVLAGSARMGQLIDDLLNLARLSRQQMEYQNFNLARLADHTAAVLTEAHPERSVHFIVQPDMAAHGDPGLLRIVMDNLIGNAWKFTAKTAAARIEIGTMQRDGRTVYYVRDNGAGFDMQYVHKLFAPFQRLHHASEFEGTGIGLATVKKIIQRHGGKIWVEGAVNAGTTAYFTLGEPAIVLGEAA